VCPIIPLSSRGASPNWGAALTLRDRVASQIGDELDVPVVAYGVINSDGTLDEHAPFAGAARRGGIDGTVYRVASGELTQLAGPRGGAHPSAGAVLMGVRDILVAFNVVLATQDVERARAIAHRVRASSRDEHSLDGVRALGFELASRCLVQVSTNIEQVRSVGPARVLEVVEQLAREEGIDVESAELVGLCPGPALAALRYACVRSGVALRCSQRASLDEAVDAMGRD
jgi:glutamate formiminotransferase